jgi:hypothetical protein
VGKVDLIFEHEFTWAQCSLLLLSVADMKKRSEDCGQCISFLGFDGANVHSSHRVLSMLCQITIHFPIVFQSFSA